MKVNATGQRRPATGFSCGPPRPAAVRPRVVVAARPPALASGAPGRSGAVPGELPNDGAALPRDLDHCQACGTRTLLAPGSPLCPACAGQARAVATRRRRRCA